MLPGPSRHGEYRKFNQGLLDCLLGPLDCLLDCLSVMLLFLPFIRSHLGSGSAGCSANNSLVTMSSKLHFSKEGTVFTKLRTSVKRPSAALPCRPIIVPFKNKKTGGTTLWMQRSGCGGTLDVEALNGETISLMIKEGCLSLDIIRVGTLTGETITLDVKASSTSWISPGGATKDTLIAQLNILVEELNKILHENVYVSLTSLMVTIGKVKAIRILLNGL